MLKRFRQEKSVWIKYGAFLLRRGQPGASHRVMQRALECLPNKERECSSLPSAQFWITLDSLISGRRDRGFSLRVGKPSGGHVTIFLLITCPCVAFQMLSFKAEGTKNN